MMKIINNVTLDVRERVRSGHQRITSARKSWLFLIFLIDR